MKQDKVKNVYSTMLNVYYKSVLQINYIHIYIFTVVKHLGYDFLKVSNAHKSCIYVIKNNKKLLFMTLLQCKIYVFFFIYSCDFKVPFLEVVTPVFSIPWLEIILIC